MSYPVGETTYWVRVKLRSPGVWGVFRVTNGAWERWDPLVPGWVAMADDVGQKLTEYVQRGEMTFDRVSKDEAERHASSLTALPHPADASEGRHRMPIDWTYMTRDVSLTSRNVGAVFRRTSNSGWAQWIPNYGGWVKCASETADGILRAIRLGSDIRFHEVDEATGLAAARALKPYPHLPVVSDAAMAKMYEAVVLGLPFEEAGVADTDIHRMRFFGVEDDWHRLPETDRQRLVRVAVALRRAQD